MDFSKFETKEQVLEVVRKIKDRIDKVDEQKAEQLRMKARVLLNFYKNFDEAQVELR